MSYNNKILFNVVVCYVISVIKYLLVFYFVFLKQDLYEHVPVQENA